MIERSPQTDINARVQVPSLVQEQPSSASATDRERTVSLDALAMRAKQTGRASGTTTNPINIAVSGMLTMPAGSMVSTPTAVTVAAANVPAAPGTAGIPDDETAVRETLQSYADAYEQLDVDRTAAVWPTVDRRALTRAFDTLKSQGMAFDNCSVAVTGDEANAQCRGTIRVVRKVGSAVPLESEQEWSFRMRRLGTDWKIEEVSAAQPADTVPRTRGQQ